MKNASPFLTRLRSLKKSIGLLSSQSLLILVLASPAFAADDNAKDIQSELAELRQIIIAQQAQIDRLSEKLEERQTQENTAQTSTSLPASASFNLDKVVQTKNEGFSAKIYGLVKLDASYDTQKTTAGNLAFTVLPEGPDGKDDEFNMTAKQSRLGLDICSGDTLPVKTSGKFEIDFFGSSSETNASPRMRHAYLQFDAGKWNILAGQTNDISQPFLPVTVNLATYGQQGALWARRPQIRFTRNIETESGKWSFATGFARTTGGDVDGLGQEDGKDYGIPTLQGRLSYEFDMNDQKASIALTGQYGTETADLVGETDARDYNTQMVSANLHLPITDKLDLTSVIWTGENLSCIQGGIGQGINWAKDTEIAATGGWLQLGYKASDKVKTYLTYGIDDPDDDDLNPGQRSKNQTLSASAYWNFARNLTWAFEYSRMKTDYLDMDNACNNRFQSALILVF